MLLSLEGASKYSQTALFFSALPLKLKKATELAW